MNGRRSKSTVPMFTFSKELIYVFILLAIFLALLGCSSLGDLTSEEAVGVVASEIAEAAPIVAANPTIPGILTAIISVVAGVAGAGFGAAAKKSALKKKIADGALGKRAIDHVDSL